MINKNFSTLPDDQEGWFKSSYSNASGGCVEVKFAAPVLLVRDSKDRKPGQPIIGIPLKAWAEFLDTIT